MFTLDAISYSNNGNRIDYNYSVDASIVKYFNLNQKLYLHYQEDISSVPKSILVIPLLANIAPIAWFVGFDIEVDELDQTFFNSLLELKKEFAIHFPQIKNSSVKYKKLIRNDFSDSNTALLFSGGLDAFESLTRNIKLNPYLISVHGADIAISDTKRWEDFKRFNKEEKIINDKRICYVESNLRTFYTYEVDLLINIGWWGKIQHGMALLSVIAPLSFLHNITTILIGSSNTGEVSFGWGSTSETDEKVRWANQKVIHDGFQFRRTEKIENIVKFATTTGEKVKLRVCYSELRNGYNCNRCAKCQRTMLGFILEGQNPNEFGFNIPSDFYELLLGNFNDNTVMTVGVKYEWQCLQDKARTIEKPYVFIDEIKELASFEKFKAINLNEIINKNKESVDKRTELKFKIINRFPKLFNWYLKIRRQL